MLSLFLVGISHCQISGFESIIAFLQTGSLQNDVKTFCNASILKLTLNAVIITFVNCLIKQIKESIKLLFMFVFA